MASRNIITQTSLGDLRFVLNELAENLSSHVNASVSRSHGINALYYPSLLDSFGNEVGPYFDSNGDVLGTHQLRFTINDTAYYAPANLSGLDPQPPTTGLINEAAIAEAQSGAGGSAWVTDFTSTAVSDAVSIGTDVLLPHTLLGHWESHRNLTAFAKDSFDTAGHKIGDHVIILQWNGAVYELPCSTRLGGPAQPPRITLQPINAWVSEADEGGAAPDFTISAACTGTLPITFQWQVFGLGVVWQDIAPSTNYMSVHNWFRYISGNGSPPYFPVSGTGVSTSLFLDLSHTSSSSTKVESPAFLFRCRFTNSAGSTLTNETKITMIDPTGSSCWVVSANYQARGRRYTPKERYSLWRLHRWAEQHEPDEQGFYCAGIGHELVARMQATGFDFRRFDTIAGHVLSPTLPASQRYARLRETVIWALQRYWPDCPHPVWQRWLSSSGHRKG